MAIDDGLPSEYSIYGRTNTLSAMTNLSLAFFLKSGSDNEKHNASILLSQYGSDAEPIYSLRHLDPSLPASKNRYAAAIYDSYNPEVLFGEVLLIPTWTQPSLSQEEIRLNGGVPPPPQPILPTEFTIQLYNPDQQVILKYRPGSWNSATSWDFEMPQRTFRQPSASALDRTTSDPAASITTPKLNFKWKREGKLSKDLVCMLSGKSSEPDGSKRKNREPDITISIFKYLRDITLYEPNLYRVEMEDSKGLELVLLLSAIVIRDVYFSHMRQAFNISEIPRRNSNEPKQRLSPRPTKAAVPLSLQHLPQNSANAVPQPNRASKPHQTEALNNVPPPPLPNVRLSKPIETSSSRPPPTDPRSQWEIDAETIRLKKQVEHEERERKHAERAEMKRVKKMVEAEEREAYRKRAEIDKETERLKRRYANEQHLVPQQEARPALPLRLEHPQRYSAPQSAYSMQQQSNRPQRQVGPYLQPARPAGPYLQLPSAPNNASTTTFFGRPGSDSGRTPAAKCSFFNLRSQNVGSAQKLSKKRSSVF